MHRNLSLLRLPISTSLGSYHLFKISSLQLQRSARLHSPYPCCLLLQLRHRLLHTLHHAFHLWHQNLSHLHHPVSSLPEQLPHVQHTQPSATGFGRTAQAEPLQSIATSPIQPALHPYGEAKALVLTEPLMPPITKPEDTRSAIETARDTLRVTASATSKE